ncbi:YidC/Oxa1 family insertase periplasmic-domain containing protein [Stratiformator vulcanicus]|uniref:Membrane protein insertase YidC n=1 Tax=Stratiformator vulcanicus TaxID=2527980 RepID=A0A517R1Z0_9PLAN|nr:YidC/Oxa1 family insertase periplasmic-domain containing protein [Stratiformator vulcanicus]QDT37888.1 Membrane protein insertase YidC [Stratiformator vulcanicus]
MDHQKRLVLFMVISCAFLLVWTYIRPAPVPNRNKPAEVEAPELAARPPVEALRPGQQPARPAGLPDHPNEIISLGSLDPNSGYFMRVNVTSRGAAVESVELNDPRYRDLDDRKRSLRVVGTNAADVPTLATDIPLINAQLPNDERTQSIDWKVIERIKDEQSPNITRGVVLGLKSPDGSFEVRKRYVLRRGVDVDEIPESGPTEAQRDKVPAGYLVDSALQFRNLTGGQTSVRYELQGPTGLPLENEAHTSKYRDLELGFIEPDGGFNDVQFSAGAVVERADAVREALVAGQAPPTDDWTDPLRYAGVEIQYFVALVFPTRPDGVTAAEMPIIDRTVPDLITADDKKAAKSDISLRMRSVDIDLPPNGEKIHRFTLYAGPQRKDLLKPLGAGSVMDLGWFWFVSEAMLYLLHFLHDVGIPYGFAIICMTVLVRSAMFPLSRKQAISAARMKDLQPKIEELKKKYGEDREKLGRAQMELFAKEGINPIAGCLPIVLQLPIFIGLYSALNNSVDLRMAHFFYIDNLAAPDQLFHLPFELPILNTSAFNLLPIITVVLFYFQQKLFMPPATSPEQEMQYKMMSVMPLFMGFFFYHVPAGLCVYFISSSLWSVAERKLLAKHRKPDDPPAESDDAPVNKFAKEKAKKPKSFWSKLLESVDEAKREAELSDSGGRNNGRGRNDGKSGGGGGRRKKSKSPR